MSIPKLAILGAGNVGGNLGVRLSQTGHAVTFGARDPAGLADLVRRCCGEARATSIADAVAGAEVVFLALPQAAVLDVVKGLGAALAGKVVVDCANAVGRTPEGPTWAPPPAGSISAAIAQAVPEARVVKAFNTFGAEFHLDPTVEGVGVDVYIAGDDAPAKATVTAIAQRGGFTPVDAGPLRNAALLESLAVLWIHLAMKGGHGRHVAFKLIRRG